MINCNWKFDIAKVVHDHEIAFGVTDTQFVSTNLVINFFEFMVNCFLQDFLLFPWNMKIDIISISNSIKVGGFHNVINIYNE